MDGYDTVPVVIDSLTKISHFLLFKKHFNAQQFPKPFLMEIIPLHSIPQDIIMDKGRSIISEL